MRLAVFNDLVLDDPTLLEVGKVLVGEAVVPAAVPGRQGVGVLLVGVGELAAGQRLDIDETVRIGIGRKIDRIGFRRADAGKRGGGRRKCKSFHISFPSSQKNGLTFRANSAQVEAEGCTMVDRAASALAMLCERQ